MDLEREIKTALQENTMVRGKRQTLDALKNRTARLVIVASNCQYKKEIEANKGDAELMDAGFNSEEIGAMCRRNYTVSALAVLNEAVKKKDGRKPK